MTYTTTLDAAELSVDPAVHPERFEGVRSRRSFAFLVDAAMVLFLMLVATVVIAVFGLFTFGLGWLLFPIVWPAVAVLYTVLTLGRARLGHARHAFHGHRDPHDCTASA